MTKDDELNDWVLAGIGHPLRLSGENEFSEEELAIPDYSEFPGGVKYTDEFIWSFDRTLAMMLDIGLTGIMGHKYTYPPKGIKEARDVFRAYATNDDSIFISSEEKQAFEWAFDWLQENFRGLWT